MVDISDNKSKKLLCKNIAKFYVKIGHLYAAILATINPIYTHKTKGGVERYRTLLKKNMINKKMSEKIQEKLKESDDISDQGGVNSDNTDITDDYTEDIDSLIIPEQANLCSKRIQTLLSDYVETKNPNEKITLRPLVCNSEYADTSVLDETGIPELFNLYKDVYNPNI